MRPLTYAQHTSVIRARIVPRLGHVRLQALTGGHLNALYRELEQAGLSVGSRRQTHGVLHRALKDAVRWGRLVRNPADKADPPRAERSRAQAWTAKELARFLTHVEGDRMFPLWRLAATTGMRRGELLGLTWRCLDLEEARLSVALTEGVPVHIVAARLGDDPNTVLSTYAHLLPQSDELAAEPVGALLASG